MSAHKLIWALPLVAAIFIGCSKDSGASDEIEMPTENDALYFPPISTDIWEKIALQDLNWDETAEKPLYDFLEAHDTDAFIILKNGKIVIEKYFGGFTKDQNHAWNSAGKTLTAFTLGIAQEEGHLSIEDSSQEYLGEGWSSLTSQQEEQISIWNHLTMTTGVDYGVDNNFCTDPECLLYKNDAGTFWFYHNATYTLLDEILTNALNQDFRDYFNAKIRDKIGMQGLWVSLSYNNVYFSTARSMARFGLLNLNNGIWESEALLSDTVYLDAMLNTSQQLNPAYGYLWWLNGKSSFRMPGSEESYPGTLMANAPEDLVAGLGKNDQKLYIVPSQKLVIVRMGGDAGQLQLGPSSFDNELWSKINALIK
ncbi:serine hydrolase domain-containing protein [Pareuzebyella sediminis]|uniref:serine hydrolase domain-containing protein n=1 Tax=Pareuzebyella sediminis TaxID=2607998 RepID=UPI0011EDAB59|nr:serine hydrolase [Pareuzebyella sediminis]